VRTNGRLFAVAETAVMGGPGGGSAQNAIESVGFGRQNSFKKMLTPPHHFGRVAPHTDTTETTMRTKTLLITAALSAAGAATAMAQVYSVNAVGYINLSVPVGFSLIANQLDAGTGNNIVSKLFTGVPGGTTLYKFTGGKYTIDGYDPDAGWDDPNMTLAPGEGAWILNNSAAAVQVTFVGNVPQGTLTTAVPSGFSIVSSQVPQSAQLDTVLGFPVVGGDTIYFYRGGKYVITGYDPDAGWDTSPVPNVGESFWVSTKAAKTWTRTFSVNQ